MAAPILLIGATGQIGWELRRVLAPLAPIEAPGRKLLDLSDEAQVRRQVRAIRPALIVNAAAHTAVDKAEEEEQAAMTVWMRSCGAVDFAQFRLGEHPLPRTRRSRQRHIFKRTALNEPVSGCPAEEHSSGYECMVLL